MAKTMVMVGGRVDISLRRRLHAFVDRQDVEVTASKVVAAALEAFLRDVPDPGSTYRRKAATPKPPAKPRKRFRKVLS